MTERPAPPGLRAARTARGWSQADAARELAALARALGAPVAAPASLKTLLSRWENGHVVPEPQYRALLGELYGRTPAELGISGSEDREAAPGPGRLRAAVAAAAAVEHAGLGLWWEQLALAGRLDDQLGAAGAGEVVRAQVERLVETLVHTLTSGARAAVAAVLAPTAALAGSQALDRGRHDEAWHHYDRSRAAAEEAALPVALAVALAGQADVLVDAGAPAAAVALLDGHDPLRRDHSRHELEGHGRREHDPGGHHAAGPGPVEHHPGEEHGAVAVARVRLDAARGLARAAVGEEAAARGALAAADRTLRSTRMDLVLPRDGPVVELADLHRWHGRALVTLGDAAAVDPLQRALAAPPRSVRDRAGVLADLALALAEQRPGEAADHARSARDLARSIGSERIPARLSALGNRS